MVEDCGEGVLVEFFKILFPDICITVQDFVPSRLFDLKTNIKNSVFAFLV